MKEIDDFVRAQCAPLLKARERLAMPAGLDSGLVQLLRCVSSAWRRIPSAPSRLRRNPPRLRPP